MSARTLACPSPERLSRAVTQGADEALRQHLGDCDHCRDDFAAEGRLLGLLQQIEVPELERDRLESARSALLARAPARPAARRASAPLLWTAALAAAVLLAVMGRGLLDRADGHRGTVVAHGSARFLHEEARRDEVVRLSEGEIHVEVEKLRKGERFRVVVGDAEVEVRGTAFEVRASGDKLLGVRVMHGLVEVRPAGRGAVLLRGGERWSPNEEPAPPPVSAPQTAPATPKGAEPLAAEAPAAPAAPKAAEPTAPAQAAPTAGPAAPEAPAPAAHAPRPAAPTRQAIKTAHRSGGTASRDADDRAPTDAPRTSSLPAATRATAATAAPRSAAPATEQPAAPAKAAPAAPPIKPAPAPAPGSPEDRAFAAGWQALRAKDYRGAASAFGQTAQLAGDRPLGEDARYWLAVSQARGGQREAAIGSLRAFLARHPQSPRAPEVSSILGWQLLRKGDADLDEAERLFRAAGVAPLREVRESAHAGLTAIAARRAAQRDR